MTTIIEQAQHAELALAAYADLALDIPDRNSLINMAGLSESQADQFREKYTVVDQYNVTSGAAAGLSATVFEDKETHIRYLAIRGTDDDYDVVTDVVDIAVLGGVKYQAQYQALKAQVSLWQTNGVLPDGIQPGQQQYTVAGHSLAGFLSAALAADLPSTIEHTYLYNAPGFGGNALLELHPWLKIIKLITGSVMDPSLDPSKVSNIKGDAGTSPIAGLGNQVAPTTWIAIEDQFNSDVVNYASAFNHSQQVLSDALALYAVFSELDHSVTVDQLAKFFKSASNQNKLTLESTLDSLRKMFLGKTVVHANPTSEGNRESFFGNLYALQDHPNFMALQGKVLLGAPPADGLAAKTDFGAFLSLMYLTPFAFNLTDDASSAILKGAHQTLADQWDADKALSAESRAQGQAHFTDQYLTDRAKMLDWIVKRNAEDIPAGQAFLTDKVTEKWRFEDMASDTVIDVNPINVILPPPQHYVRFGKDDAGDNINGGDVSDYLYGGGGNDTISGGKGSDYIEGNLGEDTIYGGDGGDILLGGVGNDLLAGGKESDWLFGGKGSDTYVVHGSEGFDTILDSDGQGKIVWGGDETGAGGVTLTGGKHRYGTLQDGGIWESIEKETTTTYIYQKQADADDGTLIIKRGETTLYIKRWKDGDLGITLGQAKPLTTPVTDREISGDYLARKFTATVNTGWTKDMGLKYDSASSVNVSLIVAPEPGRLPTGLDYVTHNFDLAARQGLDVFNLIGTKQLPENAYTYRVTYVHPDTDPAIVNIEYQMFDELGNVIVDAPIPRDWDDTMHSDVLLGSGGNDKIDAGSGGDLVLAGAGNDLVVSGTDGEIEGYIDTVNGEAGNDTIFANEIVDLPALATLGNFGGEVGTSRSGKWLYGDEGNDYVFGGTNQDVLFGGAGKDVLVGGAGNDVLNGDQMRIRDSFAGGVIVQNTAGSPFGTTQYRMDLWTAPGYLQRNVAVDVTPDENGDDDMLYGGAGDDRLHGGRGHDVLVGESGNDIVTGEDGDDYILGGAGDDLLTGEYHGGTYGNGLKVQSPGHDFIDGGAGSDILQGEDGNDILIGGDQDDYLWGDAHYYDLASDKQGHDYLDGGDGIDRLFGQGGNDTLTGGQGDDVLDGGEGDDTYLFNVGDGNDRISDTSGKNRIIFGTGITPNSISLGLGSLLVHYGSADDALHIDGFDASNALNTAIIESFEFADGSSLTYGQLLERGFDLVGSGDISGTSVTDRITGSDGNDTITAGGGDDILSGAGGADDLVGDNGDDILIGAEGADALSGGEGNDTYKFELGDGNDILSDTDGANTIMFGDGIDREAIGITTDSDSFVLRYSENDSIAIDYLSVAYLEYRFADGTVVSGNQMMADINDPIYVEVTEGDNILLGGSGNDTLYGGYGDDSLRGGAGADELESEDGYDIVDGNDGSDWLNGGAGDDFLSGGAGNDELFGGEGNDTYYFEKGTGHDYIEDYDESAGDLDIIEFSPGILPDDVLVTSDPNGALYLIFNDGADRVIIQYWFNDDAYKLDRVRFADGTEWDVVELNQRVVSLPSTTGSDVLSGTLQNDVIDGLAGNDAIYGAEGDDVLIGGEGNDIIEGYTGNDIMQGGSGDDYIDDWDGSNIYEAADGNDTLYSSDGMNFIGAGRGDDYVGSWGGDNIIAFNADDGNDTVYVGQPLTLSLGGGIRVDDLSLSKDGGDIVLNIGGDSIRLAQLLVDYDAVSRPAMTLQIIGSDIRTYDFTALLADFEAAITLGASSTNWLMTSSISAHLISTSIDRVIGGELAYRYAKDGDLSGLSTSQMQAMLSVPDFGVAAQLVEIDDNSNIVSGTESNDQLVGTDGTDVLLGGGGDDTLDGGLGDDTYLINAGDGIDTIIDDEGIDTIQFGDGITADSLSLGIGSLLVRYSSSQDAIHIEGFDPANALSNPVVENFRFADGSSLTYEQLLARGFDLSGSGGIAGTSVADRITGSAVSDFIDGGAGNDWLQGLGGNDQLQGGSGDDTIDGGFGVDTLIGGTGNDTYLIATSGVVIMENAGEGIDQVHSRTSYQLGANIENLTLIGRNATMAVGNNLDNALTGSAANNMLIGGGGADTMIGGEGDDIYYVDHAGDIVNEQAGEGIDLVDSSISYTVCANIEILSLSGFAANGTGNSLNNLITGNSVGNTLNGLEGHDILQGDAGNDMLSDSQGNNLLDGGFGADTIIGGTASDFVAGGGGNDMINIGAGTNVIAFNRGDGMDTVVGGTDGGNTLSLGNSIQYADLMFQKNDSDLILYTGANEQITFKDWYVDTGAHTIDNLQLVIEDTADYNPASLNQINSKKVQQFDFEGLVAKFDHVMDDAALLTSWSLSSSLLEFHLGGSEMAAIGGDLAYQYAKNGNFSTFSMTPAQVLLADSSFGTAAQNLQIFPVLLQDSSPRLM